MKTESTLTKKEALAMFGGERGAADRLARAIGVTRQAVEAWPDGPLRRHNALAVLGALRAGQEVRYCTDCRSHNIDGCSQGRAAWPHGGAEICKPRRRAPGYQPWEF